VENEWARVRAGMLAYPFLGLMQVVMLVRFGDVIDFDDPSAWVYVGVVGSFFVLDWRIGLAGGLFGLLVVALSRYASLGSLLGVALGVVLSALVWGLTGEPFVFALAGGSIVLFQHRDNIYRLLSGTERKLGSKAEKRE